MTDIKRDPHNRRQYNVTPQWIIRSINRNWEKITGVKWNDPKTTYFCLTNRVISKVFWKRTCFINLLLHIENRFSWMQRTLGALSSWNCLVACTWKKKTNLVKRPAQLTISTQNKDIYHLLAGFAMVALVVQLFPSEIQIHGLIHCLRLADIQQQILEMLESGAYVAASQASHRSTQIAAKNLIQRCRLFQFTVKCGVVFEPFYVRLFHAFYQTAQEFVGIFLPARNEPVAQLGQFAVDQMWPDWVHDSWLGVQQGLSYCTDYTFTWKQSNLKR